MITNRFVDQIRVLGAFMHRDIKVMFGRILDDLINCAFLVLFFNFVTAYLSPLIGARQSYAAEGFLGTIFGVMLFITYARSINILIDMTYDKFIDYRRCMPITHTYFIATLILSILVHLLLITLAMLLLGKIFLGSLMSFSQMRPLVVVLSYLITPLFLVTFFLSLIFTVSLRWFRINIWQRILTPLHFTGCLFYTWPSVLVLNKYIAFILLFNPFTYCNEALRQSVLSYQTYIPAGFCLIVLGTLSLLAAFYIRYSIRKNLDWV